MLREGGVAEHRLGAGEFRHPGEVVRHAAKIRRHPDGAEPEAGEHALEQLVAVLRLHQHPVPLADPALVRQHGRHRLHPPVEVAPGPDPFAPDEGGRVRQPPRLLLDQMRKVHGACAEGGDGGGYHALLSLQAMKLSMSSTGVVVAEYLSR